jgi:predicted amidohydrolase
MKINIRSKVKVSLVKMVILVFFCSVVFAATHERTDWKGRFRTIGMKDIKVTVAAMHSVLLDPNENVKKVEQACKQARKDGARLLLLPECMLSGHGGHRPTMEANSEAVPEGPMSQAVLKMSKDYDLCICVGINERADGVIYNSVMVADRGKFLGVQRKINLSSDERRFFADGSKVEVFDIGDIRFGISICYDNNFPELALIHKLHDVDLILAAHASRTGDWPEPMTAEFGAKLIKSEQKKDEKLYSGTAYLYNIYILSTNAVGSATEGIEGVVSNHAGTVFGVDPHGEVILRTKAQDEIIEEIQTVELKASKRLFNHHQTRNRDWMKVKSLLNRAFEEAGY